jgi:hypothetical protein
VPRGVSNDPVGVYPRQELAGRLLEKIKPMYRFELEPGIRAVLPRYNLSIEQLPQHFARDHVAAGVHAEAVAIQIVGGHADP